VVDYNGSLIAAELGAWVEVRDSRGRIHAGAITNLEPLTVLFDADAKRALFHQQEAPAGTPVDLLTCHLYRDSAAMERVWVVAEGDDIAFFDATPGLPLWRCGVVQTLQDVGTQFTLLLKTGALVTLCTFDDHIVSASSLAAWPIEVAPYDAVTIFENVASMRAADKATMELWLGLPAHGRCAHRHDGMPALRSRLYFSKEPPGPTSRASVSRLCHRLGVLPFLLSDYTPPDFLGAAPLHVCCITGSAYLGAPKLQAVNRRVKAALQSRTALPADNGSDEEVDVEDALLTVNEEEGEVNYDPPPGVVAAVTASAAAHAAAVAEAVAAVALARNVAPTAHEEGILDGVLPVHSTPRELRRRCCLFAPTAGVFVNSTIWDREAMLGLPAGLVAECAALGSLHKQLLALGSTLCVPSIHAALLAQVPLLENVTRLTVLSLFSGIGAAEIAIVDLALTGHFVLDSFICVEINDDRHLAFAAWFRRMQAQHPGPLGAVRILRVADVCSLGDRDIQRLVSTAGGASLIIGAPPCNDLSSCNRDPERAGLEGRSSGLFYEGARWVKACRTVGQAYRSE